MKKLLCLFLVLLLPCAALADTYTEVAKHYLNTYGQWWNYSQALWLEFVAAAKAAEPGNSNTCHAIAATEYILPPEDALPYEEAKAIAINAVDASLQSRPLVPCFLLEERTMYKVILYSPSSQDPVAVTVELDAYTGDILGVYPYMIEEAGYFFTPNAVWKAVALTYTPEELAQMSWSQLADAYIARHGTWWDWNSRIWCEFATAVRQADVSMSRTGRAIAATEYITKPPLAMYEEEAAERAAAGFGTEAYTDNLILCCLVEDRAIYKVTVHTPEKVCSVELDAHTGNILGIYPQTSEDVGQFFVPHDIWEAIPATVPNG